MADNEVEWRQTTTCKHPPGTLAVYRNEGIRWVECSDCHTVFENRAYSEALEARIKELEDGIRRHREDVTRMGVSAMSYNRALWSLVNEGSE